MNIHYRLILQIHLGEDYAEAVDVENMPPHTAQPQAKKVSPSTSQRQAENVPPAYGEELEEVNNLTTRELLLKLHGGGRPGRITQSSAHKPLLNISHWLSGVGRHTPRAQVRKSTKARKHNSRESGPLRSYPEDLILRDSGTQTSPVKSTPPPTDTSDVVVLENDVGANEDLKSQNNPWGGPEIIVPVQPLTSTAGVTAQGPQQVPPQPPPLPPPYPPQPPKQQRPKSSESDAVTLVNNAGGTEFLMMQFSKMIREEVTRAIDMRLGQPEKQMPSRQKGRIEPTRPESQKQPATSPTSPRGEPSRPGGGGGYSETWQEVVTRNYQGVRGPRAETHPSSNTSTNNRFTPLGGGDNAKRREPFPSLPPPQPPSPSTPGKRRKKGGQNPTLNPQRPPAVQQEPSNTIREKDTFPGADIVVQPRFSNVTVTCNDVWTELTKTVNPRDRKSPQQLR
nr:PREDICTED: rho GTPase-activating protein 17-like [Bemisia tabaci]